MNNKLLLCIRIQLNQTLNQFAGKLGGGSKRFGKNAMVFLIVASLIYASVFYSLGIMSSLPASDKYLIVYMMAFAATAMIIFFSIQLAQGNLFAFKDFDFLMSLPLPKSTIMISKMVSFLVINYGYSGFLLIPTIVIYGIQSSMGILYYLYALIGFIALPLIPMVLSSIIALLIRALAGKSRFRSLFTNLLSIVVFGLIFIGSFALSFSANSTTTIVINPDDLIRPMMTWIPFVGYYVKGVVETDFVSLLISLVMNFAVFALFVFAFNKTFIKINSNLQEGYHVKNYRLKRIEKSSCLMTLYGKELKKFFGNFMYVMNMAMGQVMLVLGAGYVLLNKNVLFGMLEQLAGPQAVTQLSSNVFVLVCGACIFFALLSNSSAVSISLEGKNLWIVKSLPIKTMDLFMSKILVNVSIIAIPSLIGFIAMTLAFDFNLLYIIEGLLLIGMISFFVGFMGITVNLFFPKLEFDREILVIKQSAASFIAIMGGMVVGLALFVLLLSGMEWMAPAVLIGVTILFFALANVGFYFFLSTKGSKMFTNL